MLRPKVLLFLKLAAIASASLVLLCQCFSFATSGEKEYHGTKLSADYYGDALPVGSIARCGTICLRHQTIRAVKFSNDRKLLAVVGEDNRVTLWDLGSGKVRRRFGTNSTHRLSLVEFSPDDSAILAADVAGNLWLWNLSVADLPKRLNGHSTQVCAYSLSPDGKLVASTTLNRASSGRTKDHENDPSSNSGQKIQIWELANGNVLKEFKIQNEQVNGISFIGQTGLLAVGSLEGNVWACEIRGEKIRKIYSGADGAVSVFGFEKGVFTLAKQVLRRFSTDNFDEQPSPTEARRGVLAFAITPDGKTLAVRKEFAIHIIDMRDNHEIRRIECERFSPKDTLSISSDGVLIAVSTAKSYFLQLWNVNTGRQLFVRPAHSGQVDLVNILSDGKTLLSLGDDGRARVWELSTGRELFSFLVSKTDVWSASVARRGSLLAFCASGTTSLVDIWQGTKIWDWKGEADYAAFSPTADLLALAETGEDRVGRKSCIHILGLATGKELRRFDLHTGTVAELVFSPDGSLLACGGKSVQICDTIAGHKPRTIGSSAKGISPLFFSSSDKIVLKEWKENDVGFSMQVGLWDVVNGEFVKTLPLSTRGFLAQSFDQKLLAIKLGQTIEIREWPTMKKKHILKSGFPVCASFSPNSDRLVSADTSGDILVWDLVSERNVVKPTNQDLSSQQFDFLWKKLESVWDYEVSIDRLVDSPQATLQFIKQRLRPVPRKDVMSIIARLDSPNFMLREQATDEIRKLEFAAFDSLKNSITGIKSPEFRERVSALLSNLSAPNGLPEWRQQWNSVIILEQIGTTEAKQFLQSLADGTPDAKLTKDARAAVDRLNKRRNNH